jgi:hypothetical protein
VWNWRHSRQQARGGRFRQCMLHAFSTKLQAAVGMLVVPLDSGEAVEAIELIKGLPLEGAVVTGDAAFTFKPIVWGLPTGTRRSRSAAPACCCRTRGRASRRARSGQASVVASLRGKAPWTNRGSVDNRCSIISRACAGKSERHCPGSR